MESLVSVVVPIYMVEEYLTQCVKSIQEQRYKNIEIILVDDGSSDKSGEMCDEFKIADDRIIVIHKHNGGLSSARNTGLKIAKGEYICFVDSDDVIDKDYISDAIKIFKQNQNVDIVQCKNLKFYDTELTKLPKSTGKIAVLDNALANELLSQFNKSVTNLAWDKVYKKSLFDDIVYPEGKLHEDEYTTYKLIYKANSIALIDKYNYYYRQRENSIVSSKFNIKRLDALEAYEQKMDFYKRMSESVLYKNTVNTYVNLLIYYYFTIKKNNIEGVADNIRIKINDIGCQDRKVLSPKSVIKIKILKKYETIYYHYWLRRCKY